jgi:hypothetical protein
MRNSQSRRCALTLGVLVSCTCTARAQDDASVSESAHDTPVSPAKIAESKRPRLLAMNAIYVEGGGPSVLATLNYDRKVGDFSARIGISPDWSIATAGTPGVISSTGHYSGPATVSVTFVPLTVSYLGVGSGWHHLEVGAGGTFFYVSNSGIDEHIGMYRSTRSGAGAFGNLIAGYRLQPRHLGFVVRVGVDGVIGANVPFAPLPYLGLGFTF